MLTNAPNVSATPGKLDHLMLTNANLSSDFHASAIIWLIAIESGKGQSSQLKFPTLSYILSTLANALHSFKDHLSTVLSIDSGAINLLLSSLASAISDVQRRLQYFPRDGPGEENGTPRANFDNSYAVLPDISQPAHQRKAAFRTLLSAQPIISKKRHLQNGRILRRRPSGGC